MPNLAMKMLRYVISTSGLYFAFPRERYTGIVPLKRLDADSSIVQPPFGLFLGLTIALSEANNLCTRAFSVAEPAIDADILLDMAVSGQ